MNASTRRVPFWTYGSFDFPLGSARRFGKTGKLFDREGRLPFGRRPATPEMTTLQVRNGDVLIMNLNVANPPWAR